MPPTAQKGAGSQPGDGILHTPICSLGIIKEGSFKSENARRMGTAREDTGEGCAIRANSKTKYLKIHPLQ